MDYLFLIDFLVPVKGLTNAPRYRYRAVDVVMNPYVLNESEGLFSLLIRLVLPMIDLHVCRRLVEHQKPI